MTDRGDTIERVCHALTAGNLVEAASTLKRDYPFAPLPPTRRRYGPVQSTRVFVRDGFVDRYTGDRLVFPPVLRLVSIRLPAEFPFHTNWKTDVTHPAFWEVGATVDHLVPVSRGGTDEESNWVTTSMARNSAKLNWTVAELGWRLYPPGNINEWDGMLQWFMREVAAEPGLLENGSIHQWHRAARLLRNPPDPPPALR